VVLRIEAVVLHPGVFAGFLERERAVGTADRAAEGLRPVIDVAQLAKTLESASRSAGILSVG